MPSQNGDTGGLVYDPRKAGLGELRIPDGPRDIGVASSDPVGRT